MDNRIALSNSQKLYFPSMTVTVEGEIGRGSNSIVYRGTYPDMHNHELHHVLIKELFPAFRLPKIAICSRSAFTTSFKLLIRNENPFDWNS